MLKKIPRYGWFVGLAFLCFEFFLYRLANDMSRLFGTYNWAMIPKIPAIDDRIPFVGGFVIIYLYSYFFWICGPAIATLTGRKNFINYLIGLTASYLVGFLFFFFMPTYMDRIAEGLLVRAEGPGLIPALLRFTYYNDGAEQAFNLFPSYHCLISIYCYLAVRKRPEIPTGIKVYSVVMTILICLSTVLIKQHYVVDVFGGLLIPIVCYAAVRKIDPARRFFSF